MNNLEQKMDKISLMMYNGAVGAFEFMEKLKIEAINTQLSLKKLINPEMASSVRALHQVTKELEKCLNAVEETTDAVRNLSKELGGVLKAGDYTGRIIDIYHAINKQMNIADKKLDNLGIIMVRAKMEIARLNVSKDSALHTIPIKVEEATIELKGGAAGVRMLNELLNRLNKGEDVSIPE